MATDATGTPTPLGIPKFNTSVDAPSGLGSNAQMDSIDTLLANRAEKPAGIVSGEVPVWNGTTWVRSSVTRISTVRAQDIDQTVAFSTYTPAWTSSGTAPAIGNGTLSGRYIQIGRFVCVTIRAVFGSTTTFGTGAYFFSFPVTAASQIYTGSAYYEDVGGSPFVGISRWATTTTFNLFIALNPAQAVTNTTPFVWAANDVIEATICYEAA